ncbi:hypothetical protein XENOCAPTIV_013975 [Xenoophorus captivus]|uniref:Uncharacterized protein n=1 Tax=Xenoophorus captivus TaxID=1517983 RepID=A0ABV0QAN3_9TELE
MVSILTFSTQSSCSDHVINRTRSQDLHMDGLVCLRLNQTGAALSLVLPVGGAHTAVSVLCLCMQPLAGSEQQGSDASLNTKRVTHVEQLPLRLQHQEIMMKDCMKAMNNV